jgi:hypothetical protein
MKLAISTIVSAIVLFILAFLFYWIMFSKGLMSSYYSIMRTSDSQLMWANMIAFLIQGFMLSIIYKYYYKGESPFKEGLIYGLQIGLLLSVPVVLFMRANYTVRIKGAIADSAAMGFRILIACIVIGLIFGKKIEKSS